ncbi:hypothetical protein [Scytonema sp. NUACC26]
MIWHIFGVDFSQKDVQEALLNYVNGFLKEKYPTTYAHKID